MPPASVGAGFVSAACGAVGGGASGALLVGGAASSWVDNLWQFVAPMIAAAAIPRVNRTSDDATEDSAPQPQLVRLGSVAPLPPNASRARDDPVALQKDPAAGLYRLTFDK